MNTQALTLCQPWAHAVVHLGKRVENRTWPGPGPFPRPVLIHAGKSRRFLCNHFPDGSSVPHDQLVFGAVVGVVTLTGCVRVEEVAGDPWAEGPWCWTLSEPRALAEPIPVAGALGLWCPPQAVLWEAKRQLGIQGRGADQGGGRQDGRVPAAPRELF
jgi:hypothetical protein